MELQLIGFSHDKKSANAVLWKDKEYEYISSPEDRHLDVVGVLARSNEPESYAGWTSRGPGRDTHARQVKG